MLDLAFSPDRTLRQPVYRQLAEYLHGLIDTGRLAPGVKLPATRELARAVGLNRNTVTQAYQDLLAEGLLTAHVGQGTFVAEHVPAGAKPIPAALSTGGHGFVWSSLFAQRTRALPPPRVDWVPEARFNFQAGQVAGDALPTRAFRKAMAFAVDYHLERLARPQDPFGWYPLREQIAAYLLQRGIECDPDQVIVMNGAQQGIDLAARVLLDPGDTVVVEQPSYFGATMAFAGYQANLVGVGVDEQGMRTDDLARVLRARRVKLIYTTPAAQHPTGVVMSPARRAALLALADEAQTPILEDDYDSELRYGAAPIAALKTIDRAGQVIYTGTFSKVLFPGVRVGYVVAAPELRYQMVLAGFCATGGTSALMQVALAEFMRDGFERHLRRLRTLYAARLDALLQALSASMPAGVTWARPGGGQSVWVTLPPEVDADALYRAARAAGIAYTRGDAFFLDGRGDCHLQLCFANHTPEEIAEGIDRLGSLAHEHCRAAGTTRRSA